MELDSLPVFSSRGTTRSIDLRPRLWMRTLAVTSIFPFRPKRGDQRFSSMSVKSVTVTVHTLSCLLRVPSLGLQRKQINKKHKQYRFESSPFITTCCNPIAAVLRNNYNLTFVCAPFACNTYICSVLIMLRVTSLIHFRKENTI